MVHAAHNVAPGEPLKDADVHVQFAVFDNLPRKLKDALRQAEGNWCVEEFIELASFVGIDEAVRLLQSADKDLYRQAYPGLGR